MGKEPPITEPGFYKKLGKAEPGLSAPLRDFLRKAAEHGIRSEFQQSLVLRFFTASGQKASAGDIRKNGRVVVSNACHFAAKFGKADAGCRYLDAVAELIGGRVEERQDPQPPQVLHADGKMPRLRDLLDHEDKWLSAIAELVRELRDAR